MHVLVVNPTYECLNHCGYCRSKEESLRSRSIPQMDPKFFSHYFTEKSASFDIVRFAGDGEPTLHPQLSSMVSKTLEHGKIVQVITNGYYFKISYPFLSSDKQIQEIMESEMIQKKYKSIFEQHFGFREGKIPDNFSLILSLDRGHISGDFMYPQDSFDKLKAKSINMVKNLIMYIGNNSNATQRPWSWNYESQPCQALQINYVWLPPFDPDDPFKKLQYQEAYRQKTQLIRKEFGIDTDWVGINLLNMSAYNLRQGNLCNVPRVKILSSEQTPSRSPNSSITFLTYSKSGPHLGCPVECTLPQMDQAQDLIRQGVLTPFRSFSSN